MAFTSNYVTWNCKTTAVVAFGVQLLAALLKNLVLTTTPAGLNRNILFEFRHEIFVFRVLPGPSHLAKSKMLLPVRG